MKLAAQGRPEGDKQIRCRRTICVILILPQKDQNLADERAPLLVVLQRLLLPLDGNARILNATHIRPGPTSSWCSGPSGPSRVFMFRYRGRQPPRV